MKQFPGQLSLFEMKPKNEKNESLGEPCKSCDVEWCSAICFVRRGYMWSRVHRFEKDNSGKPLRKVVENRECKKTSI